MGEKDVSSYRCNECSVLVKAKSGNTSNLRQHLKTKHTTLYGSLLADEAKQCKVMVSNPCDLYDFTKKVINEFQYEYCSFRFPLSG